METTASSSTFQRANETVLHIRAALPEVLQNSKVAIVCGSGLGGLAQTIEPEPKIELAYETIPNFPRSTGESVVLRTKSIY